MRIEVLERLFVAANPGGSLDFLGNGKYYVFYGKGRVYDYRSTSHYALAERFGLIPEPEPITDQRCREIVRLLRSGQHVLVTNSFDDTLRCAYLDTANEDIEITPCAGLDDYDRTIYQIVLKTPESDPVWWDYNVTRWQSS
jgi:hypothetical protein